LSLGSLASAFGAGVDFGGAGFVPPQAIKSKTPSPVSLPKRLMGRLYTQDSS
jgi:hypothetical protein